VFHQPQESNRDGGKGFTWVKKAALGRPCGEMSGRGDETSSKEGEKRTPGKTHVTTGENENRHDPAAGWGIIEICGLPKK